MMWKTTAGGAAGGGPAGDAGAADYFNRYNLFSFVSHTGFFKYLKRVTGGNLVIGPWHCALLTVCSFLSPSVARLLYYSYPPFYRKYC